MALEYITENINIFVSYIFGLFSGLGLWLVKESKSQRDVRREWYSELYSVSSSLSSLWSLNDEYLDIHSNEVSKMDKLKEEVNTLQNPPIEVDDEVQEDLDLLYDLLNGLFTDTYYLKDILNSKDGSMAIDTNNQANDEICDIYNDLQEIQSIANRLEKKAESRANNGIKIPGTKTKF